ncbi:MAG: hypothetical protein HPY69_13855 [Armatimonadetes bacterium]|nr:hypothetical protein [Armatimonadota bacterium]
MQVALVTIVVLVAIVGVNAAEGPDTRLSPRAAADWVQWLSPLPKQVHLTGRAAVPVTRLRLRLPHAPTELDRNLADELSAALQSRTGVKPNLGGVLQPTSVVMDFRRQPDVSRLLAGKRNADQAYCLEMTASASELTVTCHALTDRGSYYGMKTLKQLLLPTVSGEGRTATVDIPAGRIVDWPDLEERGQWGGSAFQDLEWLTDLKYNLLEVHANVSVDAAGVGHASMAPTVLERCRRFGVRVVPIIHHLEQLVDSGLFEAYPMLLAKDADTGNPSQRVICFARPEIVKPLADWLVDLGNTPGVTEVMVWLSEEGKGCQCEQCCQAVRFVQELEACVKALRAAQQSCPHLGLRVLLTQGSYDQNAQVLEALPADVKVSYYHGGLTYNTERKPMIYPVLESYLRQKRWLGVYPTLSSNWLTVAPFSNPEFTHYRLTEFVDKGLSNIVAYIVPTAHYYRVNTEGGLEWAWNAHGRNPREFAVSYAVRHSLKDPETFAQWTEALGPVSWDLYASNFPYLERWGAPVAQIAAGKMRFDLGQSIFAAYSRAEQFDENLVRCDTALALAEALGDPEYIAETRIVRGYTQTLRAVYRLSRLVHGDEGVRAEDRDAAARWFAEAQEGLEAVTDSYPAWSQACQAPLGPTAPERFTGTLTLMETLAANLGDLAERCGFEDAGKPYRLHTIGTWDTEDFVTEQWQTRRLDVTRLVDGPGTYAFRPAYRSGDMGLSVTRVALVSFPRDRPDEVREEAVDEHRCHAGAWVENDLYTLVLKDHDPTRGHAVLAAIGGTTKPHATAGDFLFRKLRP